MNISLNLSAFRTASDEARALSHWHRCLADYVAWAQDVVDRAAGVPAGRDVAQQLACGLAGLPKDLEAAAKDLERHLRMESAKK